MPRTSNLLRSPASACRPRLPRMRDEAGPRNYSGAKGPGCSPLETSEHEVACRELVRGDPQDGDAGRGTQVDHSIPVRVGRDVEACEAGQVVRLQVDDVIV